MCTGCPQNIRQRLSKEKICSEKKMFVYDNTESVYGTLVVCLKKNSKHKVKS